MLHINRNGRGNVRCKMVQGAYNLQASNGYGGTLGEGAVQCRDGFLAIGKTCMVLPEKSEQIFVDAMVECSEIDAATLYGPSDDTQNGIMRSLMKYWVWFKRFVSSALLTGRRSFLERAGIETDKNVPEVLILLHQSDMQG